MLQMAQRYIRSPRSSLGQPIGTVGQALSVPRVPPSDQRSLALEVHTSVTALR